VRGCDQEVSLPDCSPDSAPNAVWGGLMGTRAKCLGVAGAVIEGRIRDRAEMMEIGLPVYAKGNSTLGAGLFSRVSSVNLPITLCSQTISPVTVNPGDIIVADTDGVVCIPAERVAEVAALCGKLTEIDARCMADVKAGKPLADTFKKHRG
jgi:regulator of RNase E activity RraA